MGRFFSILIATFISVLAALTTWHFTQKYLTSLAVEQAAERVGELDNGVAAEKSIENQPESKEVVAEIGDRMRYEWTFNERTNPVTGEKVATATRLSEDTGGAITFRCYGMGAKYFDVLVSFPNPIEWSVSRGAYASMWFRIDDGKLFEFFVDRNSSSVALPDINKLKDRAERREFKKIGGAALFRASIPDGTLYQQTISIDLSGIEDAIAPVLALCGKTAI